MGRSRYWKITADEMVDGFTYDESKLLNWEIKCVREPEVEPYCTVLSMPAKPIILDKNCTSKTYNSI